MRAKRTPILTIASLVLSMAVSSSTMATSLGAENEHQASRRLWKTIVGEGADSFALAVAPDGSRVYATGCTMTFPWGACVLANFLTVAFDPITGAVLWSSSYNLPGSAGGEALAIAVSPDGTRVFVTGPDNDMGYVTVAYEASTGTEEWASIFTGFGGNAGVPYAIGVSADSSKVFVTGTSDSDFGTVGYDAASGAQLWLAQFSGPDPGGFDLAIDLGVAPDGTSVFVTGSSPVRDDIDFATVAYDQSSGSELWSVRYHDRVWPQDTPYALAVSPDGARVFVTGCRTDLAECYRGDYLTIALDASTGTLIWKAVYDGAVLEPDIAYDVGVSPDNSRVYVTGTSPRGSTLKAVTIGYEAATGTMAWLAEAGSARGPEFPWRLAVTTDRVVVTGETGDYQGHRFLTIGYDAATGGRAWSVSGPDGLATGLGTSPGGNVAYVTGYLEAPSAGWVVIAVRT